MTYNWQGGWVHIFNYFVTYRRYMLVKSKVRIYLNSKQFFSWTWFYQASTKINFFRSFQTQKEVFLFRVGFHGIVVKPCKEFTSCYLQFRNNCINVGRASLWSCIVSIVFNVKVFNSWNISIEFILKSNRPKIEPCRTPHSIFNLLLKHSFI